MNDFCKENDLDGSQGDLRALGHPQRPRQAQPVMFIKYWHDACLYAIFQRQIDLKLSQCDTGWSIGSRTPSATLSSSTMGSSASTTWVHQKLIRLMFLFFKDKWFQNGSKVSMVLLDTLSDLDILNQGEYSKYQLCSSKFNMTHVYFFKDKSI